MIDYLFIYEHKNREIDSICLLKTILEKKGFSVDIAMTRDLELSRYRRKKNRPKVVVVYSAYDDNSIVSQVLSVAGTVRKVVNLQWEQIPWDNDKNRDDYIPKGMSTEVIHFCWGEKQYNRLNNYGIKYKAITGCLQMDFLKPPLSSVYRTREDICKHHSIDIAKRILLFISSFSGDGLNEEDRRVRSRYTINYDGIKEFGIKNQEIIINWLRIACRKGYCVVYRPHPSEVMSEQLKASESENFRIISEGSVNEWILLSDKITLWLSTTIAQVYFSKKECGILCPVESDYYKMDIFEGARIIKSTDEFVSYLNCSKIPFPLSKSNIVSYYGEGEDYAYERIINELERIYESEEADIKTYPLRLYIKALYLMVKRYTKCLLLRIGDNRALFNRIPILGERYSFFWKYYKKDQEESVSEQYINEKCELISGLLCDRF